MKSKQMARTPSSSNKQTPQSMKKGPSKPSLGKPTPKQQFQVSKGGPTPGKSPAKNFASPKQALKFQTPKQTPKSQTSAKKPQTLGKKVSTPHPMKKLAESDDDSDEFDSDEEMDSDESFEDESDEGKPANGSLHKQKQQGPTPGKQAAGAKKGQPVSPPKQVKKAAPSDEDEEDEEEEDEDDEDEDLSDEEDESLEDEFDTSASDDSATVSKNQKAIEQAPAAGKLKQQQISSPGKSSRLQLAKQLNKSAAADELEDEQEFESDEDDEEFESEEDDEEETDSGDDVPVNASQLQKKQDKSGPVAVKKPVSEKAKPQAQQSKTLKRSAPAEESDEEAKEEQTPKKGAAQASSKPNVQPQKKLKTKDGSAAAVQMKADKKEKKSEPIRMPTKLDKKLQDEMEERRRERDRRSLFIKNLPRGTTDEEIKALSSDIGYVKRKGKWTTWCWVSFANEQVCEKNYEKLKNGKLGNAQLFIDFCGEKSQSGPPKQNLSELRVDALRLYVGSMPSKTTEADLKRLFPTATSVYYRPDRTFAFINYDTPEKARQAFENGKDAKINGSSVVVAFARMPSMERKPDAVKKFANDQATRKVVKVKG